MKVLSEEGQYSEGSCLSSGDCKLSSGSRIFPNVPKCVPSSTDLSSLVRVLVIGWPWYA